jgi:hypothetical protein
MGASSIPYIPYAYGKGRAKAVWLILKCYAGNEEQIYPLEDIFTAL